MKEKFKKFVSNVYSYMNKPEMLTLPSSLAYYFFLALVPIVSFLLMLAARLNLSTNYIVDFIEKNFSKDLVTMITPMITNPEFSLGFIIYLLSSDFKRNVSGLFTKEDVSNLDHNSGLYA